jgi:hypothetical protein
MAGTVFLRDILRKSCSCPKMDWWYNILILGRETEIPISILTRPVREGIISLPAD